MEASERVDHGAEMTYLPVGRQARRRARRLHRRNRHGLGTTAFAQCACIPCVRRSPGIGRGPLCRRYQYLHQLSSHCERTERARGSDTSQSNSSGDTVRGRLDRDMALVPCDISRSVLPSNDLTITPVAMPPGKTRPPVQQCIDCLK
jgi:hypothetical protein